MKLRLLTLLLLCGLAADAQTPKIIFCKPDRATVYFNGAQLFYSETLSLPAGVTVFSFSGVSPFLDPSTIVTGGKGDFTILDAQFNTRYPDSIKAKPENPLLIKYKNQVKMKQDSSYEMYYQLQLIQANKDALVAEKGFLQNNPIIRGVSKRDSFALVKDALEYFRQRQNNIDQEWVKLIRQQDKLTVMKQQLEAAVFNLNALIAKVKASEITEDAQPIYEILVTVSAEAVTSASIQFNYYTANASWAPQYDLKAASADNSLVLVQKANLVQHTAVDWKNVKLTLSTGNPSQGNTKPYLNPFYISLIAYMRNETLVTTGSTKTLDYNASREESDDLSKQDAKKTYDYTVVQNNWVQTEYVIDLAYSIPSDGKPHNISIQKKEMKADFKYYAVPRMDRDAFLQASITDWEDMNLVYGNAKIYFDNSYVGESVINPNDMDDTLNIDLGRDKTILVERKLLKEKSKTGFIDDKKTVTRSYTITLRNTKANNVSMVLQDQVPLSVQKDIVVTVDEKDGAKLEDMTGILTWNVNLKPKETRTFKFTYTVKYPGSLQLNPLP